MVLKLSQINSSNATILTNNRFIVSSVVDSQQSPEEPVLIRTEQDLNTLFGTNWDWYDFYLALIEGGVSLFLFKPISSQPNTYIDGYVNTSDWTIQQIDALPDTGESNKIYQLLSDKWIFDNDLQQFIKLSNLPQFNNQPETSRSWINRDSLIVNQQGINCYKPIDFVDLDTLSNDIDTRELIDCYHAININLNQIKDRDYLMISLAKDNLDNIKNYLFVFNEYNKEVDEITETIQTTDLINELRSRFQIIQQSDEVITIYSESLIRCNSSVLSPNYDIHNQIIYNLIEQESVHIQSKLLGKLSDPISVQIQKDKSYLVTIQKGDYTEAFSDSQVDQLILSINRTSQLIRITSKQNELPLGKWFLSGSKIEEITPDSRFRTLDYLKQLQIKEDYLLINNINDYSIQKSDDYQYFLDYASLKDTQVLINCHNDEYKINFLDTNNRLIYFLGDIQLRNQLIRPGYYFYLMSTFSGDWEIPNIIQTYQLPSHDCHSEIIELDKYKCNYLILCNNKYSYYKFNKSDDDIVSGTTRYVLSRVSRIFDRYKWNLLAKNSLSDIRLYINGILDLCSNDCSSLIYSLTLDDMNFKNSQQSIELNITLRTREFIDKDINLNINLNFS